MANDLFKENWSGWGPLSFYISDVYELLTVPPKRFWGATELYHQTVYQVVRAPPQAATSVKCSLVINASVLIMLFIISVTGALLNQYF